MVQPLCPETIEGPSCNEFEVPDIDVAGIAGTLGSSDTSVRITISEDMLRRLRMVAAQRSQERDYEQTTVNDVLGELIEERIEFLEESVR